MNARNPLVSWSPTLAEFDAWLSNTRDLSDNQRRAAQRVRDQYRQSVVRTMERTYDDAASHNEREQDAADRILGKLNDLLADAKEWRRRGEIDGDQLLQIATEVERDRQRAVAMSEAAAQVEERAWEEASMTPEAFQSKVLNTFPALKSRLPRITDDVMDGRSNPFA
jgi:hypothetical protein